jgi:hypothetical protein
LLNDASALLIYRLAVGAGADGAKLIAFTEYGQESDRQNTRAAGFDHLL